MRRKHLLTQINRLCRSFTKKDASGIASKSDETRLFSIKKSVFFDVFIKYTGTIKRNQVLPRCFESTKLFIPWLALICRICTNYSRLMGIQFDKRWEIQGSLTMFVAQTSPSSRVSNNHLSVEIDCARRNSHFTLSCDNQNRFAGGKYECGYREIERINNSRE